MICKNCHGKLKPILKCDSTGKHYYWRCDNCDREIDANKVNKIIVGHRKALKSEPG